MKQEVWLEPGKVYRNRCGDDYLCKSVKEDSSAILERLSDRWTLVAHGAGLYPDGTIEWDYSTGGFWPDKGQKETPAPPEKEEGPAIGTADMDIECPLCHSKLGDQEPETVEDLKWRIFSEAYHLTKKLRDGQVPSDQLGQVEQLRRNLNTLADILCKIRNRVEWRR